MKDVRRLMSEADENEDGLIDVSLVTVDKTDDLSIPSPGSSLLTCRSWHFRGWLAKRCIVKAVCPCLFDA